MILVFKWRPTLFLVQLLDVHQKQVLETLIVKNTLIGGWLLFDSAESIKVCGYLFQTLREILLLERLLEDLFVYLPVSDFSARFLELLFSFRLRSFERRLGLVVGVAVEGDLDGLPVGRFELDFLATTQQVHKFFDEFLILLHPIFADINQMQLIKHITRA